jgi:hypothetical protein
VILYIPVYTRAQPTLELLGMVRLSVSNMGIFYERRCFCWWEEEDGG